MQIVILAAGKGTRMGGLTKELPKVLHKVCGKSLLEHKLEILPKEITEIILVVNHKEDLIRNKFGNSYKGTPITYIKDETISGTAHSLWYAKEILKEKFMVMMGDDIYSKEALSSVVKNNNVSIVCKKVNRDDDSSRVIFDNTGNLSNFVTSKKYREEFGGGGMAFTGLYLLDTGIFKYEPVKMKTKEEWGLPHTLLSYARNNRVEIVETDSWHSVNSPEDLARAEFLLCGGSSGIK